MGILIASVLTLFINKDQDNKILACLLVTYISVIEALYYFRYPVFQDYLNSYIVTTLVLCMCMFVYTKRDYIHKVLVLSVVVPHLYYLLILYKPYLLHKDIPLWWLFNADTWFIYGVFFILYEQRTEFKFNDMKFKDFMLNMSILFILVLF